MLENLQEKETQTIQAIKSHIACKGYWRMNGSEQEAVLQALLGELNTIWDKQVILHCDFENSMLYAMTGGGRYNPQLQAISLYKGSLMTFLHEFAHALFEGEGEEISQRWSHRMFKGALPRTYLNGVENNSFLHTVPAEQ